MKSLLLTFAMFAVALAASAADISGTWKGTAQTPAGNIERTFTFKVDGSKLTGETTSNMSGKSVIEDGKVDGDNISFTIKVSIQGQENEIKYMGKVAGDQIKFTVEIPAFNQSVEFTAKRVT